MASDCDHGGDTKHCCGTCGATGTTHTYPPPAGRSESLFVNGREMLVYVGVDRVAAVEVSDDTFVCGTYQWFEDVGFIPNEHCINRELLRTVEQKLDKAHG